MFTKDHSPAGKKVVCEDICEALKKIPCFNSLECDELKDLAKYFHVRRYEKEDEIFKEFNHGNQAYFVLKGSVSICIFLEGKRHVLNVLFEGDFLGIEFLFKNLPPKERFSAVSRMDGTELLSIQRNDFREILKRYPMVLMNLMEYLCDVRTRDVLQQKCSRHAKGEKRLIETIKFLQENGDKALLLGQLKHDDFAELIFSSREFVTRTSDLLFGDEFFLKNEKKKIIGVGKKISNIA